MLRPRPRQDPLHRLTSIPGIDLSILTASRPASPVPQLCPIPAASGYPHPSSAPDCPAAAPRLHQAPLPLRQTHPPSLQSLQPLRAPPATPSPGAPHPLRQGKPLPRQSRRPPPRTAPRLAPRPALPQLQTPRAASGFKARGPLSLASGTRDRHQGHLEPLGRRPLFHCRQRSPASLALAGGAWGADSSHPAQRRQQEAPPFWVPCVTETRPRLSFGRNGGGALGGG